MRECATGCESVETCANVLNDRFHPKYTCSDTDLAYADIRTTHCAPQTAPSSTAHTQTDITAEQNDRPGTTRTEPQYDTNGRASKAPVVDGRRRGPALELPNQPSPALSATPRSTPAAAANMEVVGEATSIAVRSMRTPLALRSHRHSHRRDERRIA